MAQKTEFHLDILVKKEEDYYSAHCLQFDLVATDNTPQGAKKAIKDLCIAHIANSIANENMEFLFSPAPQEVWAEYYASLENQKCEVKQESLPAPEKSHPAFHIQEVSCYA
jgi:hypothetical protein